MFRFMQFLSLIASSFTLVSLCTYAADEDEKLLSAQIQPIRQQPDLLKAAKNVLGIATYFVESEQYLAAATEYEKGISMLRSLDVPVLPNLYERTALCYYFSSNILKAIDHYEAAKKCTPDGTFRNCQSYLTLATAYVRIENHKQALKNFKILFSLTEGSINPNKIPVTEDTYFTAAQSAMTLKKWEKAIQLYNKGFNLMETPNAYAYANMGRSNLELKNYLIAHDYLTKAIQIDPELSQIVYDQLNITKAALEKENN